MLVGRNASVILIGVTHLESHPALWVMDNSLDDDIGQQMRVFFHRYSDVNELSACYDGIHEIKEYFRALLERFIRPAPVGSCTYQSGGESKLKFTCLGQHLLINVLQDQTDFMVFRDAGGQRHVVAQNDAKNDEGTQAIERQQRRITNRCYVFQITSFFQSYCVKEEFSFVAVVEIHGAFGDTRSACHLIDAGLAIAVCDKQISRRQQNAPAFLLLFLVSLIVQKGVEVIGEILQADSHNDHYD